MTETDTYDAQSEGNKKIRKKRSRSSSPRRGSTISYEPVEGGVRIDVYVAVTLFAMAIVFIKLLPKY